MLKTFNKAQTRCPIVFYEEINAVFFKRKILLKMTKITNFPDFQSFYATFVKFSTDFVDWYVEKGIQGKLFRRVNCSFQSARFPFSEKCRLLQ